MDEWLVNAVGKDPGPQARDGEHSHLYSGHIWQVDEAARTVKAAIRPLATSTRTGTDARRAAMAKHTAEGKCLRLNHYAHKHVFKRPSRIPMSQVQRHIPRYIYL
jgi:hypothetical protein